MNDSRNLLRLDRLTSMNAPKHVRLTIRDARRGGGSPRASGAEWSRPGRQMRTVVVLLALCGASASVAGTSLDAPVTPDHPTIRSEIQRAHVASRACNSIMDRHLPTATVDDVIAYHDCMSKIISDASNNGTYSAPFEIGIDFDRLNDSSIMLKRQPMKAL
jgi:hypothetical protein